MSQYQPYGAAPTFQPPQPLAKSPRLLAHLTIGGLVAVCSLQVIAAALDIGGAGIEIDAARNPGDEGATNRLLAFGLVLGAAGLAAALSYLFTAVVFICWLFRARKNVDAFGVTYLRWAPGWTIGSWFIPFANLVIPVRVVGEIAEASVHEDADGAYRQKLRRSRVLVGLWWGAVIVMGIVDRVDAFHTKSALSEDPTAEQLIADQSTTVVLDVLGLVTTIAAAVLAGMVVRRITKDQQERAEAAAHQPVNPVVPQPYSL